MSKKKIAWFISILFVPLLIPTYTYLVLLNIPAHFNMMLTQSGKWNIILLVFVVTAIMPILIITIVKRNKNLSKFLLLEERQERILPLIITCIFLTSTVKAYQNPLTF